MTTPYYQDEFVTLYHGDCREVTEWLEADVLVTDPPYGRSWRAGSRMTNSSGGGRGSKAHGGILSDRDTTVRDAALAIWGERRGIVFGDLLIQQPANAVQVLIYAKPLDAGIKGARGGRRRDAEAVYLTGPWKSGVGGKSSILRTRGLVAGPTGAATVFGHPHAKPVDLMSDLIGMTSGVIADSFAGSGSTLLAAKLLDRKSVGVELDERYCEIAAKRLAQGVFDFGGAA